VFAYALSADTQYKQRFAVQIHQLSPVFGPMPVRSTLAQAPAGNSDHVEPNRSCADVVGAVPCSWNSAHLLRHGHIGAPPPPPRRPNTVLLVPQTTGHHV